MLTNDQLKALQVGAVVECGPIMQGLAPDQPLCMKVERTNAHDAERKRPGVLIEFSLWYFDIPIGLWAVKLDGEEQIWIDVERARRQREGVTVH
jgi:hypothetical protein